MSGCRLLSGFINAPHRFGSPPSSTARRAVSDKMGQENATPASSARALKQKYAQLARSQTLSMITSPQWVVQPSTPSPSHADGSTRGEDEFVRAKPLPPISQDASLKLSLQEYMAAHEEQRGHESASKEKPHGAAIGSTSGPRGRSGGRSPPPSATRASSTPGKEGSGKPQPKVPREASTGSASGTRGDAGLVGGDRVQPGRSASAEAEVRPLMVGSQPLNAAGRKWVASRYQISYGDAVSDSALTSSSSSSASSPAAVSVVFDGSSEVSGYSVDARSKEATGPSAGAAGGRMTRGRGAGPQGNSDDGDDDWQENARKAGSASDRRDADASFISAVVERASKSKSSLLSSVADALRACVTSFTGLGTRAAVGSAAVGGTAAVGSRAETQKFVREVEEGPSTKDPPRSFSRGPRGDASSDLESGSGSRYNSGAVDHLDRPVLPNLPELSDKRRRELIRARRTLFASRESSAAEAKDGAVPALLPPRPLDPSLPPPGSPPTPPPPPPLPPAAALRGDLFSSHLAGSQRLELGLRTVPSMSFPKWRTIDPSKRKALFTVRSPDFLLDQMHGYTDR